MKRTPNNFYKHSSKRAPNKGGSFIKGESTISKNAASDARAYRRKHNIKNKKCVRVRYIYDVNDNKDLTIIKSFLTFLRKKSDISNLIINNEQYLNYNSFEITEERLVDHYNKYPDNNWIEDIIIDYDPSTAGLKLSIEFTNTETIVDIIPVADIFYQFRSIGHRRSAYTFLEETQIRITTPDDKVSPHEPQEVHNYGYDGDPTTSVVQWVDSASRKFKRPETTSEFLKIVLQQNIQLIKTPRFYGTVNH
jgi:hypothetical protein